ncbi:MAG: calcium-binding protein, partial [Alphaproteobacteria bacterium]
MAVGVGGQDNITLTGDNHFIAGGADNDTITILDGIGVALGDQGQIEFRRDIPAGAVTGTVIETADNGQGGDDVIETTHDRLIAFGGAGSDQIRVISGGSARLISMGDGGKVWLDEQDRPIELMTWELAFGGNDVISGGSDDDVIAGGIGNDNLSGNGDHDILLGDTGHLVWDIRDGVRTLVLVTAANASTTAHGGSDTISGGEGDDLIYGGTGNDDLSGNAGFDVISNFQAKLVLPLPELDPIRKIVYWGDENTHSLLGRSLQLEQLKAFTPLASGGDVGHGNNQLSGGDGDDIFLITPGGTDVITEQTGDDAISFQLANQGVFFDPDLLGTAQGLYNPVALTGPTLRLEGTETAWRRSGIENVIGTPYSDTVYVSPMPVPRTLKG